MGAGVVVSATPRWRPWIADLFRGVEPGVAFSLSVLAEASRRVSRDSFRLNGPQLYSVTSSQDWTDQKTSPGYTIEVGGAELLKSLDRTEWPNAITRGGADLRRDDVVAAIGFYGKAAVGVAAASTDSEQIGIDVQLAHRGRGVGKALTSQAAYAVLGQGRAPYYGTDANNIASRRTAQSAGFYPCWVSAYTTAD